MPLGFMQSLGCFLAFVFLSWLASFFSSAHCMAWRMHIPSTRTHSQARTNTPLRLLSFTSCSLHAFSCHPLVTKSYIDTSMCSGGKYNIGCDIFPFFSPPRPSFHSLPCGIRHLFQIRTHPGSLPDVEFISGTYADCFFFWFSFIFSSNRKLLFPCDLTSLFF